MSSQQTPSSSGTGWSLERLLPYEQHIGYGLVALGLGLAAIPIANAALYRGGSLVFLIWGAALTLLVEGLGIYYLVKEPAGTLGRDRWDCGRRWLRFGHAELSDACNNEPRENGKVPGD